MNCNCSTKTSTASLYRNGQLITQASASFIVCDGNDSVNDIHLQLGYNRCGNILRICSFIKNNDSIFINNAVLLVKVCCINDCYNRSCFSRCSCCSYNSYRNNCKCREYDLCSLGAGEIRQICFDLNRNCCRCYYIETEIVVNNKVVKRESLTV